MQTSLRTTFDEKQWVEQICQILDAEMEDEMEMPVTIFVVPKSLMLTHPQAYIPHQVAIGPYHHLQPELYEIERYKVAAAKRSQKELQAVCTFQEFVDRLIEYELMIRVSYHRPLAHGCEALAWMLAIDACFLFEVFQVCGVKNGKFLTKAPSRLAVLIDLSGNKTAHNAILKDIIMLENQIPLVVIRMLLKLQFLSRELADEVLLDMLVGICKELSPFKTAEISWKIDVRRSAHLLDFLYGFVVPKLEDGFEALEIDEDGNEEDQEKEDFENEDSISMSYVRQLFEQVWEILPDLKQRPVQWIKVVIFSKPVKVLMILPWTILSKVPIIKMMKEPIENMLRSFRKDIDKKDDGETLSSNNGFLHKPPLLEEITIPSVTKLIEVGVQFVPTSRGIMSIAFDQKSLTLSIPTIDLDMNSEVVLRNLIAYEVCTASAPLFLTRYSELMKGMIDTEMDVRILCQKGIIINHLKSEREVAEMWNGLSKWVRLTKVASLDKVIADVNGYYNGRWKVKFGNFMRKYIFRSWRVLMFLGAILMLLLMSLQAFCQVYSCERVVRIKRLEPTND